MKYEDMKNELKRLEQLAEDADKARRGSDWGIGNAIFVSDKRGSHIRISIGVNDSIQIKDCLTFEEAVKKAERELFLWSNKDRFLAQTLGIAV